MAKERQLVLGAFDFMTDRLPNLLAESRRGAPGPHKTLCLAQEHAFGSTAIPDGLL